MSIPCAPAEPTEVFLGRLPLSAPILPSCPTSLVHLQSGPGSPITRVGRRKFESRELTKPRLTTNMYDIASGGSR